MSTTVDAPPRRRGNVLRWAAVVAVLVAVVVVLALRVLAAAAPSEPRGEIPTGLHAQLTDRITAILEGATPEEHHDHGHDVAGDSRMVCAVKPFGMEPTTATTPDEVRTVYAHHLCAVAEPERPWDVSTRFAGPLVVDLTQDPPLARTPDSGLGYPERVREMIPERHHEEALERFLEPEAVAALRERFNATVATL